MATPLSTGQQDLSVAITAAAAMRLRTSFSIGFKSDVREWPLPSALAVAGRTNGPDGLDA